MAHILYRTDTGDIFAVRHRPTDPAELVDGVATMEVEGGVAPYYRSHKVVDGTLVLKEPPIPPPKTPDQLRWEEYPSIGRQLLMIWKALKEVHGKPFSKDVQAMIDQMAAVDAKHPKTS